MRKQYDFSTSRKNPYAAQLKKSVTIRLVEDSITYFKSMSEQTGIPYGAGPDTNRSAGLHSLHVVGHVRRHARLVEFAGCRSDLSAHLASACPRWK